MHQIWFQLTVLSSAVIKKSVRTNPLREDIKDERAGVIKATVFMIRLHCAPCACERARSAVTLCDESKNFLREGCFEETEQKWRHAVSLSETVKEVPFSSARSRRGVRKRLIRLNAAPDLKMACVRFCLQPFPRC